MLITLLLTIIAAQAWYIRKLRRGKKASGRYMAAMARELKETLK